MKEFTPAPDSASIVSVTDRVKPIALGMGVTSAHFLGDRAAFVGTEENVALVDAKGEISKVAVHSGGILSTASSTSSRTSWRSMIMTTTMIIMATIIITTMITATA